MLQRSFNLLVVVLTLITIAWSGGEGEDKKPSDKGIVRTAHDGSILAN